MKILTIIITIIAMSGCAADTATMINNIYSTAETGESPFDGTQWVSVNSIWCDPITFDLYQDENMAKKGLVSLELNIGGTHSIRDGQSLHLNLDGNITNHKTLEKLTNIDTKQGVYLSAIGVNIPPHNVSSKRYILDAELLNRMVSSSKFVMRVDLERDYIDAVCSNEQTSGSDVPAASTTYGIVKFQKLSDELKQ